MLSSVSCSGYLSVPDMAENGDPSIFLVKGYKQFMSKARDDRGGVMLQTLEGCSSVKNRSIALDDALSANLNLR